MTQTTTTLHSVPRSIRITLVQNRLADTLILQTATGDHLTSQEQKALLEVVDYVEHKPKSLEAIFQQVAATIASSS